MAKTSGRATTSGRARPSAAGRLVRKLPTPLRWRVVRARTLLAEVTRLRGRRNAVALVLAPVLAFLVLPLLLVVLGAVAAGVTGLVVGVLAAVALVAVGVMSRPHRLLAAATAVAVPAAVVGEVRSRPSTGHRYQTPAGWEPVVTVVVTAFNDSRFLGAALNSLLDQDLPDFECIVVDDCSTDFTIDLAHSFAEVDDRFRVVVHDGNSGLPAARNTGLSFARAPWVTFLDADDFLWPSALSSRLEAVEDDPTMGGVFCDWQAVPEDAGPWLQAPEPRPLQSVSFPDCNWETPFIASAPILRTGVVRALGGFDETLRSAEDFEFYLRLLRAGYRVGYAGYVGIGYRQVAGSMIRANPALHAEVVRSVVDRVEQPIVPADLPGSIAPYLQPLSYYVRETTVLRRQLRFLALARLTGRQEQVDRMTALLHGELLDRRLPFNPVEDAHKYAVKRMRLTGPEHTEQRQDLLRWLTRTVGDLAAHAKADLDRQLATRPEQPPAVLDRPTVVAKTGRTATVRPMRRVARTIRTGLEQHAKDSVIMAPQSRYHADELGPLAEQLALRGIRSCFMVPDNAPAGLLLELAKFTDTVLAWDPELPARVPVAGAVVLNDWGPTRQLIEAVDQHGGASFAKVEGVQDFTDLDTGRERLPYRRARYVLGQGPNDAKALADREVHVVGNSRLERIWLEPPHVPSLTDPLLVNFNFTYNVLTRHAEDWIVSTQDGIEAGGREFVVSLHPAQKDSPLVRNVTPHPLRHEMTRAGALVSRFSTVLYEAMARGVPVIYHNPHGELVPDFQDPRGAFLKTVSMEELRDAVEALPEWQVDYRQRSADFFAHQVEIDPATPSEARAAAVIAGLL